MKYLYPIFGLKNIYHIYDNIPVNCIIWYCKIYDCYKISESFLYFKKN